MANVQDFAPCALLPLWAGEEFRIERLAILAFSIYFAIHLWRHLNHVFVHGLGHTELVAKVVTTEAIAVIAVSLLVITAGGGLASVYTAISLCLFGLGGWILPVFVRRELAALRPVASHAMPTPERTAKRSEPSPEVESSAV